MTRKRIIKAACWIVGLVVVVGVLMATTVQTSASYTCVLCRAELTEGTRLGFKQRTVRDTAFTEWYAVHQPQHEHRWTRQGSRLGRSIFGTATFIACGPRHPICEIPPDELRRFAERADSNTLAAFFAGIASTNRETQTQAVSLVRNESGKAR